ncbi:MAG TPA: aldolase/citrate lyase family protein [Mycobacteriales bacterium]|nr:aldolase/citrate lyase family protein [Mycobacteriales bacterium]
MRANMLKRRLLDGQPCRGVWLSLPSVAAVRLLARMPCDWFAVDAEHGPMGAETMTQMVAAIADAGRAPIVRVAQGNTENIKRALDAGAWGIIAPMVNSPAEAAAVVAAAKFPPLGQRSFGSAWAGLTLDMSMAEYRREANSQTLAFVQIESGAALDDLPGVLGMPGIDGVFVGPVDLAISLGLEPDPENPHPILREALDEVLRVAKQHGLPAGIYCSSAPAAAERVRQGFLLVNVASDVGALLQGVRAQVEWRPGST